MLVYFFILFGAVLRVLPHPDNFAPIAAIGLFSGTYLSKTQAFLATLGSMLISDYFIGFDSLTSRLTVYSALMISVLLGMWLKQGKTTERVIASSMLGSVVFFLITNFALFYETKMYSHDWLGISSAYINGLPFFKNTLMSDLFYASLFFGIYEAALMFRQKKISVLDHSSTRTN